MSDAEENDLNSSHLGTLEHWDDAYATELTNFNDSGDEGQIWFGQSCTRRIINYLESLVSTGKLSKDDPIIDIGCGNGMLLVDVWEAGFKNLVGVDYSNNAIRLAEAVAAEKKCDIRFYAENIIEWTKGEEEFKVALDKGTYDAISLNPENAVQQRNSYYNNIFRLLLPGGLFIITSCNWTELELTSHFARLFRHVATLPAPTFSFGGSSGLTVTTVLYERRPTRA